MVHVAKTVYDAPAAGDGWRIIVMRMYPRGVSRSRRHAWLPELAPSLPLVKGYHATRDELRRTLSHRDPPRYEREIARFWRKYTRKYLLEMKPRKHLIAFLALVQIRQPITLLCACKNPQHCHRSLLGRLIEDASKALELPCP